MAEEDPREQLERIRVGYELLHIQHATVVAEYKEFVARTERMMAVRMAAQAEMEARLARLERQVSEVASAYGDGVRNGVVRGLGWPVAS